MGLPVAIVDPKAFPLVESAGSSTGGQENSYAQALLDALGAAGAEVLVLAGYLRRLPAPVVAAYRHRIVNIHPSLLPCFGGKGMYGEHVHRAVLNYGVKVSGCTVHFVDEEYDTGPIIAQRSVPVGEDDTPVTLAARLLPVEHAALVEALGWLADDRLRVEGRRVRVLPAHNEP
jgi:phosphoribosylglycinamide formyltransferase-1